MADAEHRGIEPKGNKDGGLQYSRTNNGSIKPNGIVKTLTTNIFFLFLLKTNIIIQIADNINENINHSLKIAILFYSIIELYIFAKSHPTIKPRIITSTVPRIAPPNVIGLVIWLISMP